MQNLSIYLPPFAGDYSGACSVLYDLNCLVVLCDAACCTRNYINYEEPRWSPDKRTTLCAQLRTIQVVTGDDSRIIAQSIEAAQSRGAEFIVLLGSPVPALTGMDMAGMARKIEHDSGIPAAGLHTTGFADYAAGISQALLAVYKKFVKPAEEKVEKGINILGATPIDLGITGNAERIGQAFANAGYRVLCNYAYGYSLDAVRRSAAAEQNIVVTASGLPLAKKMQADLGIPYVTGMPVGPDGAVQMLSDIEAGADVLKPDGTDAADTVQAAGPGAVDVPEPAGSGTADALEPAGRDDATAGKAAGRGYASGRLLLTGDQVIAHSVRQALLRKGFTGEIDIAGFFKMDPSLLQAGDKRLRGEKDLIEMVSAGGYSAVIGDPLLRGIPQIAGMRFYALPHPAISGEFAWEQVPVFASNDFDSFLEQIVAEV